jgi:spore coat polysaccharide biosynthesis protein SpsF
MHTSPKNITAIIQARMSSSRLPGKVLREIAGKPMLAHVVERTRLCQTVQQVLVATTSDGSDDPIAILCEKEGITFTRGSQFDVLDRYYQAARHAGSEVIVRITGDCPLIDPGVVDRTVQYFLGQTSGPHPEPDPAGFVWDFAANRLPPPWGRTYPIGLDTEVCSFPALERAWREAHQSHQREHVMPYLYEYSPVADSRNLNAYSPSARSVTSPAETNHQPQFRALLVNHSTDFGQLRWTVDTAEDLELVGIIFAHFAPRLDFGWEEVLDFYLAHPELAQINAGIQHKQLYDVDGRSG